MLSWAFLGLSWGVLGLLWAVLGLLELLPEPKPLKNDCSRLFSGTRVLDRKSQHSLGSSQQPEQPTASNLWPSSATGVASASRSGQRPLRGAPRPYEITHLRSLRLDSPKGTKSPSMRVRKRLLADVARLSHETRVRAENVPHAPRPGVRQFHPPSADPFPQ